MGDLTKNFSVWEFACRDGSEIPKKLMPNIRELAENLQVIRDNIGMPMRIISGHRSPEYNRKIKGARNSQHKLGRAADIHVRGMTPYQLADAIKELIRTGAIKKGGVGIYPKFVHYDTRGRNARW